MKRFFFVFSVIMIIFLILAGGSIAAMEYGGIKADSTQDGRQPFFLGGWGITQIPFKGTMVLYPEGDLFIVSRSSGADVNQGDIVLFTDNVKWYIRSGFVAAKTQTGFSITASDAMTAEEPASSIVGKYFKRIPYMAKILRDLENPFAISVFAAVLLVSVILAIALPSRKQTNGALSRSDGEISSVLY